MREIIEVLLNLIANNFELIIAIKLSFNFTININKKEDK